MMKTKIIIAVCSIIIMLSTTLANPVIAKSVEKCPVKSDNSKVTFLDTIIKGMVEWKKPMHNSNSSIPIPWFIIGFIIGSFLVFLILKLQDLLQHNQEKYIDSNSPVSQNYNA